MTTLQVFRNEYEWWVAESLDDLRKLIVGEEKIIDAGEFEEMEYQPMPDNEPLTLIDEVYEQEEKWTRTTKTAAEWAQSNGRGFLAGTEW